MIRLRVAISMWIAEPGTVLKAIAVLGLALAFGQSSACVAQCSARPAIIAQDARPTSRIVEARWSHEIDPRSFDSSPSQHGSANANLAASAETIVVADDGGLVALDATTGHERWRTAASHLGIPAIVGDTVVAANAMRRTGAFAGAFRTVDAFALRDGTPRWQVGLPALKPQPSSNPPYAPSTRYLPPVAVATVGDGVLVSTQIDAGPPYRYDLLMTEFDARGVRRWTRALAQGNAGRVVAIHNGLAYLASVEDGAIITDVVRLLRLGRKGGFLGSMTFTIGPLGWNANGSPMFENAFSIGNTSFAVESVPLAHFTGDERQNISRTTWTYAPDGLPSDPGFGEAGIEDGFVYGLIHYDHENGTGRLYRYRLAPSDGQLPVLVDTSIAQWVAGPSHGWNVVDDGGELVALRVRGSDEVRLQLARYEASTTIDAAALDGHRLYVARSDGRVQGFDLDAATVTLDAPTRCVPDDSIDRQHAWRSIGVHGDRLLAVCARRLYAFALPAGSLALAPDGTRAK